MISLLKIKFQLALNITKINASLLAAEFWKQIPPNEPYRVILGDVRDKLYNTRERARHLLAHGNSEIPEETTFTNVDQVLSSYYSFNHLTSLKRQPLCYNKH